MGRGSRTKICALPGGLTVISVVAEPTCARGRRREPSEAEGRRGRAEISMGPSAEVVPVFLRLRRRRLGERGNARKAPPDEMPQFRSLRASGRLGRAGGAILEFVGALAKASELICESESISRHHDDARRRGAGTQL